MTQFLTCNRWILLLIAAALTACQRDVQSTEQEIKRLHNTGKRHIDQNHYDSATYYFFQARELLDKQTSPELAGRIYANIGYLWNVKMNYMRSISYFRQALEHYQQAHNRQMQAWTLLDIGDNYRLSNPDDTSSLAYYRQALSMDLPNDTLRGNIIQRIGLYCHYRSETDSALHYLKESLRYPYTNREQAIRLLYTGITYYEAQQPDSAELYLLQALQYPCGIRQKSGCYNMLLRIADDRNDQEQMAGYGVLCNLYSDSIARLETRLSNHLIDRHSREADRERTHKSVFALLLLCAATALIATTLLLLHKGQAHRRLTQTAARKKAEYEAQLQQSALREFELKNRDSYRNKCWQYCRKFGLDSRDELLPFLLKLMLE